jgi:hypothetical protein
MCLKWMPFGFLLLADILGKKTTSGWKKQVVIAGAAESFKYLISDSLKKLTNEHRPHLIRAVTPFHQVTHALHLAQLKFYTRSLKILYHGLAIQVMSPQPP